MDAAKLNEALKPFADLMYAEQKAHEGTKHQLRNEATERGQARADYYQVKKLLESAEVKATLWCLFAMAASIAFVVMAVYHFASK